MIIYADILFLLNLIITYILLVCTALFFKIPLKRFRLLLSSLLGGVYSLSILIDINIVLNIFLKIIICIIIILISFSFSDVRSFIYELSVFLILNVFLAGIVMALSFIKKSDYYTDFLVSYINISPLVLIISSLIAYVIINILTRYILKRRQSENIYKLKLTLADKTYILFGFCDSGNALTEPFSALPVCIIKQGIVKDFNNIPLKRVIPFCSIGGDGIMYGVKGEIEIKNSDYKNICVYIVEATAGFKDMKYDIILNPKIFSGR